MILCIGEAVIDMFQKKVPGLGEVFMPLPGGCSYNTSIAISRLGSPAAFLGRLSKNFFGEIQTRRLRENKVRVDLSIRCEENPILAFIKTEEGREPQYAFYDEGTADRLLSTEELPSLSPETTCIVFGSVSMCMEPIATTIEIFINKAAEKTIIAFDPNIRPMMIKDRAAYLKRFEKWAGVSTIVKISAEDYEYVDSGKSPREALRNILAMGSRLAIITLGPDGASAMLRRNDGTVIETGSPAFDAGLIADTVGAGDTFLGAFLVWLQQRGKMSHNAIASLSKNDLHDALSFANKAAAIVCTRCGAEPPTLEEVEKLTLS
jgi:fructokinase